MRKTFGSIHHQDQNSPLSEVSQKETGLAKREGILEERERMLEEKQKLVDEKLFQSEELRKKLTERLEKVTGLSFDEAKKLLLEQVEKDLSAEISKKIKEAEDEIKLHSEGKAKEILAEAMIHGVTDYVAEFTTSQIQLPDEDIKGRIIGKEGRNIRAFENTAGVDVILDDAPNVLVISSFDPVRREIAKVALDRLIKDGRIQPQRIEEIVERTKQDMEKIMCQEGERLCHEVGVYNLPSELVCLLGRFKYRFSYGQNMIIHTLEETKIGVALAKLLHADVSVVRLACLLHDVGKVVIEGDDGTHVEKGVGILKKFNLPSAVVSCVEEHHEDKPFTSLESVMVYLADAISGSRPGARHEDIENYIKRIEEVEKIATSFEGVDKAYAVAAGREVRVMVFPEKVSDEELPKLTHDIASRISKEVVVPGAIKVTAIRETRAQATALSE